MMVSVKREVRNDQLLVIPPLVPTCVFRAKDSVYFPKLGALGKKTYKRVVAAFFGR